MPAPSNASSSAPIPILLMVRELGSGGTERQLTELARSLDRSRFIAHVGCFREGIRTPDLLAAGIPVVSFRVTSFTNASTLRGAFLLGRYLRRHRIRIVHAYDVPSVCFGVPVARAFGVPTVLSSQRGHRDLSPLRWWLRTTDRMAQAVVVNCEYMRDHLLNDEHVPASKIRLCYNGLDPKLFHPASPSDCARPFTIGVTCVLRREKGLPTLLRAFARVRELEPGMRLALVGSGAMLGELQSLAAELGILPQCRFEPMTSDVRPWLQQMDIFVLPSLSEALSNSLMEAMACGCAAVASNVGGNPELIRHGETGLLFEKENAEDLASQLRRLIENPEYRRQLAATGAKRIAGEFSMEASARRMESIYLSFCVKDHDALGM